MGCCVSVGNSEHGRAADPLMELVEVVTDTHIHAYTQRTLGDIQRTLEGTHTHTQ